MPRMDTGGERIGVNGAAALLDVTPEKVRRYVQEGRLRAERGAGGDLGLVLGEVLNLARGLEAEAAEEEIFDGEVMGDDPPPTNSRLPAVPFERYERLLQQGQDYKTRLEERSRQIEEVRQERDAARMEIDRLRSAAERRALGGVQGGGVRQERDAARMEIDRLWSEIERLNLVEFQRELQEKTISTLEGEKQRLEEDRSRMVEQHTRLIEEKSALSEDRVRLEAELNALKNRGFWSRLLGS